MREPRIRLPEPPHPEERRAATRLEGWAATARPACPHGSRRRASQPKPAQLRKLVCPVRLLSTRTIESERHGQDGAQTARPFWPNEPRLQKRNTGSRALMDGDSLLQVDRGKSAS